VFKLTFVYKCFFKFVLMVVMLERIVFMSQTHMKQIRVGSL